VGPGIGRKLLLGTLLAVMAASGGVLLLRGGSVEVDPSSHDTLACQTRENVVSADLDYPINPGGPVTADEAISSWLAARTVDPLTLADVEALGPTAFTEQTYEYRAEQGPLMRFFVSRFEDGSFQVTSWFGCHSTVIAEMSQPEVVDPPDDPSGS
jgi:hypothetical protein